jgi:hypothetical protein
MYMVYKKVQEFIEMDYGNTVTNFDDEMIRT